VSFSQNEKEQSTADPCGGKYNYPTADTRAPANDSSSHFAKRKDQEMADSLRFVPAEVRRMMTGLDAETQRQIARAYEENSDSQGRRRREVSIAPTPGSRKYPWKRRSHIVQDLGGD